MKQYNRKSIRLKGHDYTSVGRYFVTIVIRNRLHLFGKVIDGKMILNKFGEIAAKEWQQTINLRDNVSLGAFMIMPDHIHFVIHIEEQRKQKEYTTEELERRAGAVAGKHMNKPGSLGAIVRGYKGAVTRQVLSVISESQNNELILKNGELKNIYNQLRTEKTIWVRNYNEAIIRTQRHYDNVTRYINDNPKKWDENLKQKLDLD
ncbi:transposase [uncultured Nonlabens sp.]|uniref:transposase n=1 Tax=uncultured Nonlabens sp. TaxID=859306 RepID=UPI0026035714|nr:transposase [uncultured Nonlabens sp.]